VMPASGLPGPLSALPIALVNLPDYN